MSYLSIGSALISTVFRPDGHNSKTVVLIGDGNAHTAPPVLLYLATVMVIGDLAISIEKLVITYLVLILLIFHSL